MNLKVISSKKKKNKLKALEPTVDIERLPKRTFNELQQTTNIDRPLLKSFCYININKKVQGTPKYQ